MRPYVLKRKNETIALLNITDTGLIGHAILLPEYEYLAPLHDPHSTDWLAKWWSRRAVPLSQGHIRQILEEKGLLGPEEYLVRNLGLSLSDYYWISPVDSHLTWEDVNLFDNAFHNDINISDDQPTISSEVPHYTPNSSLQGALEKSWTIHNGHRGLLKGNSSYLSDESFNEVIATRLHELQGFQNYTTYKLIEIHGRPYHYGCFSELFTSTKLELIPAYDIVISEKKPQDRNSYEHLIKVCGRHGLYEPELRSFLEYQIMTDFILSNTDRHLANISVLRDADTLQFLRPAPIYDSGKSMFTAASVPANEREMLKILTQSFSSTELNLLSLVEDRALVDPYNFPGPDFIRQLYSLDDYCTDGRINEIIRGYELKIELFSRWQKGEDLRKIIIKPHTRKDRESLKNIFA